MGPGENSGETEDRNNAKNTTARIKRKKLWLSHSKNIIYTDSSQNEKLSKYEKPCFNAVNVVLFVFINRISIYVKSVTPLLPKALRCHITTSVLSAACRWKTFRDVHPLSRQGWSLPPEKIFPPLTALGFSSPWCLHNLLKEFRSLVDSVRPPDNPITGVEAIMAICYLQRS